MVDICIYMQNESHTAKLLNKLPIIPTHTNNHTPLLMKSSFLAECRVRPIWVKPYAGILKQPLILNVLPPNRNTLFELSQQHTIFFYGVVFGSTEYILFIFFYIYIYMYMTCVLKVLTSTVYTPKRTNKLRGRCDDIAATSDVCRTYR